ncbi:MAG: phosphoribosylglycinamide formyltransferase [Acidimicrobiales bacterium]|nr:phosphoribosylglycinamide formyltransferase [Acidimicrobiales bacterium]RZV46671.1 MAG: phosphoribosylglycinamide formyltransferase [Acidimicrobiales bacterium]
MRLAVLVSGTGSLLEAMQSADLPIVCVLADRPCRGLELAAEAGIPAVLVERDDWGSGIDRVAYAHNVVEALAAHDVDLIAMAGFGTVLGSPVFDAYAGRIINTHPSLLPSFPGWHAVRAALDFGVKVTGCTIHVATEEVDSGPILAQEAVTVADDDTEATLHERIKVIERRLYIETLQDIHARGRVLETQLTA